MPLHSSWPKTQIRGQLAESHRDIGPKEPRFPRQRAQSIALQVLLLALSLRLEWSLPRQCGFWKIPARASEVVSARLLQSVCHFASAQWTRSVLLESSKRRSGGGEKRQPDIAVRKAWLVKRLLNLARFCGSCADGMHSSHHSHQC